MIAINLNKSYLFCALESVLETFD